MANPKKRIQRAELDPVPGIDALLAIEREPFGVLEKATWASNTLAGWMRHVGFHLAPLVERILALIKEGERVYADETTLPALAPGSGKTKTAWLWAYAWDDRSFGGTAPPWSPTA